LDESDAELEKLAASGAHDDVFGSSCETGESNGGGGLRLSSHRDRRRVKSDRDLKTERLVGSRPPAMSSPPRPQSLLPPGRPARYEIAKS
jgi:hypothetical protein